MSNCLRVSSASHTERDGDKLDAARVSRWRSGEFVATTYRTNLQLSGTLVRSEHLLIRAIHRRDNCMYCLEATTNSYASATLQQLGVQTTRECLCQLLGANVLRMASL